MAKKIEPNLYNIFEKGTEFFNSINDTISMACKLIGTVIPRGINNKTKSSTNTSSNNKKDSVSDEQIKMASYRFMKLEPECGIEAIKHRFREMVKKRRPDISNDTTNTKWFVALTMARKTLLKYEK